MRVVVGLCLCLKHCTQVKPQEFLQSEDGVMENIFLMASSQQTAPPAFKSAFVDPIPLTAQEYTTMASMKNKRDS
jgi:hypothetical protein